MGCETLAGIVEAYDRQGWHRSGSAVDLTNARWLKDMAEQFAHEVRVEPYDMTRLKNARGSLTFGNQVIPGVPLYDSPIPHRPVLIGKLGQVGSSAALGVIVDAVRAGSDDDFELARRADHHDAIVALGEGTTSEVALRNATSDTPFGVPILQIAGRFGEKVQAAAQAKALAQVSILGSRVPGRSFNVIVDITSRYSNRPLVVLTPRTGWWHCAAERGGGLACWLSTLSRISSGKLRGRTVFVATGGHELNYAGIRKFLGHCPDLGDALWFHLGANLGAVGGRLGLSASSPELEDAAVAELSSKRALASSLPIRLTTPLGEASVLADLGYDFVSVVSTNQRFHQRSDRYPANVDMQTLTGIANGIGALALTLR